MSSAPVTSGDMGLAAEIDSSITSQASHSGNTSRAESEPAALQQPAHAPPAVPTAPTAPVAPTVLRRKLTSFVGFSNLPQQWHQKSIRQGFDFNLLVVGDSGLGKSTLLNTLFEVPVHDLDAPHSHDEKLALQETRIELEESGVKLRLTVVDAPGFGDSVNNLDSWKPIVDEVEARFDQYLEAEESLDTGASGLLKDGRIHACLFFIEPTGHALKPLDVVTMKKLHRKVNLIPVIAKADTLTDAELVQFKHAVLADIKMQGIEIFTPPHYSDDDDESAAELAELEAKIPFAVIGSTQLVVNRDGRQVLGREYPWGVVEVHNEDENDFVKLRSLVIRGHMEDLRERTARVLYENYRTDKMLALGVKQDDEVFDQMDPMVRQQEMNRAHEQRLEKMQAEMTAVFQQKVTEKEAKLKSSETELFQRHKEISDFLSGRRAELEQQQLRLEQVLAEKGRKVARPPNA